MLYRGGTIIGLALSGGVLIGISLGDNDRKPIRRQGFEQRGEDWIIHIRYMMNNRWNTLTLIGMIVSLAVSITAICIAAPRTPQTAFDYQGVIVGTLAILVTALIGWQIYNIINIHASLDKFARKMSKIDDIEEDHIKMGIYNGAQLHQAVTLVHTTQKFYVTALGLNLRALKEYSLIESYKNSLDCIQTCLKNCGHLLKAMTIAQNKTADLSIFDDMIQSLKTNPPRFSSPQMNEAFQCLFVHIIDRRQNIHKPLTAKQTARLKEFIEKVEAIEIPPTSSDPGAH